MHMSLYTSRSVFDDSILMTTSAASKIKMSQIIASTATNPIPSESTTVTHSRPWETFPKIVAPLSIYVHHVKYVHYDELPVESAKSIERVDAAFKAAGLDGVLGDVSNSKYFRWGNGSTPSTPFKQSSSLPHVDEPEEARSVPASAHNSIVGCPPTSEPDRERFTDVEMRFEDADLEVAEMYASAATASGIRRHLNTFGSSSTLGVTSTKKRAAARQGASTSHARRPSRSQNSTPRPRAQYVRRMSAASSIQTLANHSDSTIITPMNDSDIDMEAAAMYTSAALASGITQATEDILCLVGFFETNAGWDYEDGDYNCGHYGEQSARSTPTTFLSRPKTPRRNHAVNRGSIVLPSRTSYQRGRLRGVPRDYGAHYATMALPQRPHHEIST